LAARGAPIRDQRAPRSNDSFSRRLDDWSNDASARYFVRLAFDIRIHAAEIRCRA
jgi:hypothetical protein